MWYLNIFPSIPNRFWSPEQAWCWTVMDTHQLVNYIWMSCSQGLIEYRQNSRKKKAVMSLNSCLPRGWCGCQLKLISYAYINQMLSIDEIVEWIQLPLAWNNPYILCNSNGNFVQTRWSFNSASSPSYWLLHYQVLRHGNINGSEGWQQIFSFIWICPFWDCCIPFLISLVERICVMILLNLHLDAFRV